MDRSVTAADAEVHGPWLLPATSHEDGGVAEARRCGRFSLKTVSLKGSPDAMNMAWTATFTSTMFRAPQQGPHINSSKGLIMKKSVYVSLVLLIVASSSAMAQSGPTPQEKMACRSDASAFCAEHIGKPSEMNACLRENKPKLSDSCRKVVEAHGG
jgi:hypothetical protein